jgi:hypothetical protein
MMKQWTSRGWASSWGNTKTSGWWSGNTASFRVANYEAKLLSHDFYKHAVRQLAVEQVNYAILDIPFQHLPMPC